MLHNPGYDFNDDILTVGAGLLDTACGALPHRLTRRLHGRLSNQAFAPSGCTTFLSVPMA